MKVDSEIICRKEPYGVVCRWIGDQRHGTALVPHSTISGIEFIDDYSPVFRLGGLTLRLVDQVEMSDYWYIKIDSPFSALYEVYRERARKLIRFISRCEAAVRAFKGKGIYKVRPELPFAAKLTDRLL